jgi:apolipoprotein N-acyltransferase
MDMSRGTTKQSQGWRDCRVVPHFAGLLAMTPHRRIALSIFSGLLLSLAFPKAGISILAWGAAVPLFVAVFSAKRPREAALYGFVFGTVYFLAVFSWATSLSRWVGVFAFLGWAALSVFQALFIVLFCLAAYFTVKKTGFGLISSLAVPLLWVLTETARSRGEFAAAGGVLGYTQYMNPLVIQAASLFRVYGVSFVIISCNFALAALFLERRSLYKAKRPAVFFCVMLSALLIFGAWRLSVPLTKDQSKSLRIVLVQPNFDQSYKMDPANSLPMLRTLKGMTAGSKPFRPHVVIWPETAVMDFPMRSAPVMEILSGTAADAEAYLVTGGFFYDGGKFFNSAFSVSPSGYITSRYDKEHLMPFGEYLPFRPVLYPLLKGTGYAERDQSSNKSPVPLYIGNRKAGMLICFESLFDGLAAVRAEKSDFLLTITNDAWFGNSSAAEHHIMAGPFRAVENRKYFVQAANSGISAVIDPYGRFVARSFLSERTVIEAVIYPDSAGR